MIKRIAQESLYFSISNLVAISRILIPFLAIMVLMDLYGVLFEESGLPVLPYVMIFFLVNPYFMCKLILLLHARSYREPYSGRVSPEMWLSLIMLYMVQGIAIFAGMLAFVLPGLYLTARLGFAEFEVVLNRKNPMSALQSSWEKSAEQMPMLLWMVILVTLASIGVSFLLTPLEQLGKFWALIAAFLSEMVSVLTTAFLTIFFYRAYSLNPQVTKQ